MIAEVDPHILQTATRLGFALLMGGLIGFERQWNHKMAGLRTNILVSLGACGFVVFSSLVGQGDPTRVAGQVVSGIGFLGAGVILREGVNVHGLNTAATLWCSSMVGTFAGGGFWIPSLIATIGVIVTNLLLRSLVHRMSERSMRAGEVETHYTVTLICDAAAALALRSSLMTGINEAGLITRRVASTAIPHTTTTAITALALANHRRDGALEQLVAKLSLEDGVSSAAWEADRLIPDA